MRVFEHRDGDGRLRSFEVENSVLGRRGAARVAAAIPGVQIIRAEASWWAQDDFCEFDLNGVRLAIEEPFGDNSRYLIFAVQEGHERELLVAHQAFLSARRPEWISSPLVYAGILLVFGLRAGSVCPPGTAWHYVGNAAAGGAALLLAWWAVAMFRGEYRSRVINE